MLICVNNLKGSSKLFDRQTGGELKDSISKITETPILSELIEEDSVKKYLPPLCESFVASDFDENSSPVQLG